MPTSPAGAEGQRIVAELRAAGVTLATIASKAKMGESTIRRWQKGEAPAGGEYIMRLRELRRLIQLPQDQGARGAAHEAPVAVLLDAEPVSSAPAGAEPAPAIVAAPDQPADSRGATQRVKDWMRDVMTGRTPPVLPSPQLQGTEGKGGAGAGAAGSASLPLVGGESDIVDLMAGALAMGIMFPAKWVFPAPYIGCRPHYSEAEAIAAPIARIIARQLKLKGYLDDTTRDLCISLYHAGRYIDRAWDVRDAINADQRAQQQSAAYRAAGQPGGGYGANGAAPGYPVNGASANGAGLAGGGPWGAAQAAPVHAGAGAPGDGERLREHAGGGGERGPGAAAGPIHQAGAGQGDPADGGLYAEGADPLGWLLQADADGRRRLGLN